MISKKLMAEKKGLHSGVVLANSPIRQRIYCLTLCLSDAAADAFAGLAPGQFAQFDAAGLSLPEPENIPQNLIDLAQRNIILRRPFSFSAVRTIDKEVEIDVLYYVLGPATLRMTTLKAGDHISLIGPLGNGFSAPDENETALLVAGGMGAPPLMHLAEYIKANYPNMKVFSFFGAKTADALPFLPTDEENCLISTDDGSAGFACFVTDCLGEWLENNELAASKTTIFTCGPEPMLAGVAEIAQKRKIPCQVSLERLMACGIGLCQSCAVECTKSDEESIYKLCCKDGPVFDSQEVQW